MDKQQALTIIKQVLDGSIKAGLFGDMEAVASILQAYQVIASEQPATGSIQETAVVKAIPANGALQGK